jgi:hypothetical protein
MPSMYPIILLEFNIKVMQAFLITRVYAYEKG